MRALVIFAGLLATACSGGPSVEVRREMENFQETFTNTCYEDNWECTLSKDKKQLRMNFDGLEAEFAMLYEIQLVYLNLPPDIYLRIERYKPLDGVAEWNYRNVDMLFSYERKSSGYGDRVHNVDVDIFLTINE